METYKERALAKANAKIATLKEKIATEFKNRHRLDAIGFHLKKTMVESAIRDIRTWKYIKTRL